MSDRDEDIKEYRLKWFDIVLGEYNSIRNESAESLKHQQSIINYGLTAIGVLIAFSANLWGKEHVVESIFALFIPFICNLIILIWNGEVRRMSRAGQYIKKLEEKIQKELSMLSNISQPPLEWETFLRKPKETQSSEREGTNKLQRFFIGIESVFSFLFQKDTENNNKIKSNYVAIILMFGGLSLFSILLGFGHNFSMVKNETNLEGKELMRTWVLNEYWWLIIYSALFVIDFMFFVYHYRYFQKVKK